MGAAFSSDLDIATRGAGGIRRDFEDRQRSRTSLRDQIDDAGNRASTYLHGMMEDVREDLRMLNHRIAILEAAILLNQGISQIK